MPDGTTESVATHSSKLLPSILCMPQYMVTNALTTNPKSIWDYLYQFEILS